MSERVPHLNARLQGFGTTIFAEMTALAVRTGAINLGQGFPDTDGPREIADAAIDAIRAGHNQYPPGIGIPELRRAIAQHQRHWYGLDFDPDTEVLVTAGATEAIAATLLALCEVGDEVVTFEPYYDSYAACTAMAGAQRKVVTLRPPDYHFDPDALRAAITPRTRLLLLNSPHNPTGKVFTRAELEIIATVCREHDLIAVTDEVYEHLVFDGEHVPLATLPGMRERTRHDLVRRQDVLVHRLEDRLGLRAAGSRRRRSAPRSSSSRTRTARRSSTRSPPGSRCPTPPSPRSAPTSVGAGTSSARGSRLRASRSTARPAPTS